MQLGKLYPSTPCTTASLRGQAQLTASSFICCSYGWSFLALRSGAMKGKVHSSHNSLRTIDVISYRYRYLPGVCKPCSGSGWVAIIFPGILVVGKVLAGCIGFAPYVQVATRVMSSMLYLNAQGCKIFETNIRGCLESMQLPCFNSCGKMIFVVLRYSSRSA